MHGQWRLEGMGKGWGGRDWLVVLYWLLLGTKMLKQGRSWNVKPKTCQWQYLQEMDRQAAWEATEKQGHILARSQEKHYFGSWGGGKCQALVSGIHRERSTSGSAEGWAPFFLALSHRVLGLSPCLFSSHSIAEGKPHSKAGSSRASAIKERRRRLMRT